jgi:hypothetical protein
LETERFPPVRRWRPVRPKQSHNHRTQSGERSVPIMNRCSCRCCARLLANTIESNSEFAHACRRPCGTGTNNACAWTPYSKIGVGVGVPAAWHSRHQQSHPPRTRTRLRPRATLQIRTGWVFGGGGSGSVEPDTPTARDSSA